MDKHRNVKVVWLCSFSDGKLRKNLSFPKLYWGNIIRRFFRRNGHSDFAVWDTNAISEIEKKLDGIELHIVAPHGGISHLHEFDGNGIHYHIFWSEWDIIREKIRRLIGVQDKNAYRINRKIISNIIDKLKPDVVHVIGIENLFYSLGVLDIPPSIPVIAQLQTLVSDERFKENTSSSKKAYEFQSMMEKMVLLRSNYIGTTVSRFRQIILKDIKPDAVFVDTTLPVTEVVNFGNEVKQFDFVYFAANINKAVDLAIEAFALASKTFPNISLDIIGGYSSDFKEVIDKRIKELGIETKVFFEGHLATHDDVLRQIRHSRYALLPLKIDIVSGTIREAMANGLPVVTTITPGTPMLNNERECVLLSPVGDHQAMANNMMRLLQDTEFAQKLRENAGIVAGNRISNEKIVEKWKESYFECAKCCQEG